jgi:hypothetical protein
MDLEALTTRMQPRPHPGVGPPQQEAHMSKFRFALSNAAVRQEGMVESESFLQAVDSLWEHVEIRRGDVLEIGVNGFPPARYECIGEIGKGKPFWKAA